MAFLGLFVGIDRYASNRISWLSFAKQDAIALHSLFSDTLGKGGELLTDENATRQAIENNFVRLSGCDIDDVVVVAFSGHGSKSHELITYDAVLNDLEHTAIPLDLLTEWFSKIPARRVLCILDCCFSGGMGAKVLQVDSLSRGLLSVDSVLDQLSGDGRLIFTASKADEPAWENNRLGHGLLTYYLLEALQGIEEVVQEGKISVYRLLEHVTRRVIDGSNKLGKTQHPTLRGKIDGELSWPIFTPGSLYAAAFPSRMNAKVTKDVDSLSAFGFPLPLIKAWSMSIPSLNDLQIDAINEFGLLNGVHLLVSAPTSSGKTMIGELAALKGILERRRAFFLLPLRALVNDKHQQFVHTYGDYGVRVIRATGEVTDDIPALMRGQYDLCLLTYEKFTALILGNPFLLDQVGTIVVDEVQMIADESRGVNLEFLLTLLRLRRKRGIEPQLIALSAVIGNSNGLERWLDGRLLRREERPVPLEEGILKADGNYRFIDPSGEEKEINGFIQRQWGKNSSQDWIIPLVRRLVSEGQQVIVFRETRGETRGCALYLARELGLPAARAALDALPVGDPSEASQALREALLGGVAFHNSNLDREERLVIEGQFREPNSTLRVITATTTLAMGVNTPAESVVIAGLDHPGQKPYMIAEYKNLVGRAGRLGYSSKGNSFLLALTMNDEHVLWTKYVLGKPEDIQSKFFVDTTDLRSLIIRVLSSYRKAANQGLSAEEINEFMGGSFGAFQKNLVDEHWILKSDLVTGALQNLETHQLIEKDEGGYFRLTQLGRLAGESGVEVESIIRIVSTLKPLSPGDINDQTLIAVVQLTCELDNVYFPLNKKSTHKEPQTWMDELRRQGVQYTVLSSLNRFIDEEHRATLRAKKAVACLLWMSPLSLTEIERILTQFGGSLDGASGDIRAVTTRSCDLLSIVVKTTEILHPEIDLSKRALRLLARLEIGATGDIADLAALLGTHLTRGDYQHLVKSGLAAFETIESSSDEVVLDGLGESLRKPEKLAQIRSAIKLYRETGEVGASNIPELPKYES